MTFEEFLRGSSSLDRQETLDSLDSMIFDYARKHVPKVDVIADITEEGEQQFVLGSYTDEDFEAAQREGASIFAEVARIIEQCEDIDAIGLVKDHLLIRASQIK